MKGQSKVPYEFFFLKDDIKNEDHLMRKRCAEASREHKSNLDEIID